MELSEQLTPATYNTSISSIAFFEKLFSTYLYLRKMGRGILSEENPGATSSLGEVFLNLVRLRRDGSASVFSKDKFHAPFE